MKTLRKSAAQVVVIGTFGILLAGCGGGSSGTTTVPPTTTINGIAVPPEPDATLNAATIAGVDSNNNGVRDDLERIAAKTSSNQVEFNNSLNSIKSELTQIYASTPQSREEALIILSQAPCVDVMNIPGRNEITMDVIFNTPARKEKLAAFNNVLGVVFGEELKCSTQ